MHKKRSSSKPKVAWVGNTPVTPISAKERGEINQRIRQRRDKLRQRYPEVHGRAVDYISHSIDDGTLFLTVVFKDKTNFSLRFGCEMFITGADFGDTRTGDLKIIREYMKPILT